MAAFCRPSKRPSAYSRRADSTSAGHGPGRRNAQSAGSWSCWQSGDRTFVAESPPGVRRSLAGSGTRGMSQTYLPTVVAASGRRRASRSPPAVSTSADAAVSSPAVLKSGPASGISAGQLTAEEVQRMLAAIGGVKDLKPEAKAEAQKQCEKALEWLNAAGEAAAKTTQCESGHRQLAGGPGGGPPGVGSAFGRGGPPLARHGRGRRVGSGGGTAEGTARACPRGTGRPRVGSEDARPEGGAGPVGRRSRPEAGRTAAANHHARRGGALPRDAGPPHRGGGPPHGPGATGRRLPQPAGGTGRHERVVYAPPRRGPPPSDRPGAAVGQPAERRRQTSQAGDPTAGGRGAAGIAASAARPPRIDRTQRGPGQRTGAS